jgi:hypothetical protein
VTRRWAVVLGAVVVGIVAAAIVIAASKPDVQTARVESVTHDDLCVFVLDTGDRRCWRFGDELWRDPPYHVGECLELSFGYRSDVPPEPSEISCPTGA